MNKKIFLILITLLASNMSMDMDAKRRKDIITRRKILAKNEAPKEKIIQETDSTEETLTVKSQPVQDSPEQDNPEQDNPEQDKTELSETEQVQPKKDDPEPQKKEQPKEDSTESDQTQNNEDPDNKEEEKPKEKNDIYLNFEDADLKTFVNYIGELQKINLITDPKIAGNKISLTIREPLTKAGAWNIFLTILEMSGFSIVKVGDIHKIIPKATKLVEPLPTYINVPAESLPESDLTIRYVTFLTNIPIEQVKGLLGSMLSQPNKLIPQPNANGFVIIDKSYNIKSAMSVIQELDRSDVKQSVTVMKLNQANADDVKKLFDSLMRKPKGHPLARLLGRVPENSVEYFPPTTKIIAEPRTNSLILLGDRKSIKKIEDFISNHVDTELKAVKSPIHIYELKHTDVDQIKTILESIIEAPDSPASKYGGIRGGVKYFKKMKFAMDEKNNRLLVSSTDEQDWRLLKKTIDDLDKPQPQVAIETMIVSVEFENGKELGSQFRSKKYNSLGRNIAFQSANVTSAIPEVRDGKNYSLLGNLMQNMVSGLGSTILTFGSIAKKNVWGMIRMLQTQTNLTVLSKPFIVTTNMKQSKITVGQKRRVAYQEAIGESSGSAGLRGYKDVNADLTLNIKPQINLDGVITLDIKLDISEFTKNEESSPDTSEKKLNTKVSVANGQILVLGGFVKTKVTESIARTPLLSKIPVLGWLFKNKSRNVTKEYIFIFMSPTIIKSRQTPGTNLYTKMKLYQAKSDIESAIEVRKVKDPIHNWFFNPKGETYSHKITDFANARYQPTSVDIIDDPYYRTKTRIEEERELEKESSGETKEEIEAPTEEKEEFETQAINKVEPKPEVVETKIEEKVEPLENKAKVPNTPENIRALRRKKLKKLLSSKYPEFIPKEKIEEKRKKEVYDFLNTE